MLENAIHIATRFIGVDEERVAMAKKLTPPKAPASKENPRDTYYEPRQYYDKDYQRDDKGEKSSTYNVGNTQTQQLWNKYHQNDKAKDLQPYCEYHNQSNHYNSQCQYLQ